MINEEADEQYSWNLWSKSSLIFLFKKIVHEHFIGVKKYCRMTWHLLIQINQPISNYDRPTPILIMLSKRISPGKSYLLLACCQAFHDNIFQTKRLRTQMESGIVQFKLTVKARAAADILWFWWFNLNWWMTYPILSYPMRNSNFLP